MREARDEAAPGEFGIASSTNTIASFGRASRPGESPRTHGHARRLFGFVMNTMRVAGVIAASTSSSAKLKPGFAHLDQMSHGDRVSKRKISNAGSGTIASGTTRCRQDMIERPRVLLDDFLVFARVLRAVPVVVVHGADLARESRPAR